MNQPIEPFRPARLTVKRAASWWPFSVVPVMVDGRRFGYVAPGKAKTFRLSGGDRVVSVMFGKVRVDLPISLREGDELSLVCGERRFASGMGRVVRKATLYYAGMVLVIVLSVSALYPLKEPLFGIWASLPPALGGGPFLLRLIRVWTSPLGAGFLGMLLWYWVARPFAPGMLEDCRMVFYLVPETIEAPVRTAVNPVELPRI
jgi:hypothetical protein